MNAITDAERKRRHRIVESTIGTHVMEGLEPDAITRQIMLQWADGEMTMEHFSAAMQRHAEDVLTKIRRESLAGAA